jgi:hypothetical protein
LTGSNLKVIVDVEVESDAKVGELSGN